MTCNKHFASIISICPIEKGHNQRLYTLPHLQAPLKACGWGRIVFGNCYIELSFITKTKASGG